MALCPIPPPTNSLKMAILSCFFSFSFVLCFSLLRSRVENCWLVLRITRIVRPSSISLLLNPPRQVNPDPGTHLMGIENFGGKVPWKQRNTDGIYWCLFSLNCYMADYLMGWKECMLVEFSRPIWIPVPPLTGYVTSDKLPNLNLF